MTARPSQVISVADLDRRFTYNPGPDPARLGFKNIISGTTNKVGCAQCGESFDACCVIKFKLETRIAGCCVTESNTSFWLRSDSNVSHTAHHKKVLNIFFGSRNILKFLKIL